MDPSKLLDWLKLGTKHLAALALGTSTILLAPVALLETTGLDRFRNDYHFWIGLIWISSVALLVADLAAALWPGVMRRYAWRVKEHRGIKRLRQLTAGEKAFLGPYIWEQKRTRSGHINDGVVRELEAVGIVRQASNLSTSGTAFPYNIQPWAWDHLNAHPELLGEAPALIEKQQRRYPGSLY